MQKKQQLFSLCLAGIQITLNHPQNNSTHNIYYKWANITNVLNIYSIF